MPSATPNNFTLVIFSFRNMAARIITDTGVRAATSEKYTGVV